MEALGIAIFIFSGLVAAPVFCFLVVRLIVPHPRVSRVLFYGALVWLLLFCAELLLVETLGSVRVRELIGPAFFPLHALLTLASAPALACVLLLGPRNLARWWPAVAALAWVLGVFSIFYQYG